MDSFLAFLGVSLVIIVTPGPDTVVTVRNTLRGGRKLGVATALGIALGQTIWALTASAGIVAVLAASAPLFLAIKYAGAAYLVYLGITALREAFRPPAPSEIARAASGLTPRGAFGQGLFSNLGNPKMAVFFASLLPQFAPSNGATFGALLLLGGVFVGLTLSWLTLYAAVVAKASDFLARRWVRGIFEATAGTVLIALGLRIAVEQH